LADSFKHTKIELLRSARGVGKLELASFVDRKMCNRTTEWE